MNQEISQANLKMQNKFENCNSNAKIDYKTRHKSDKKKGENLQSTHIENKTSNSEPIMKVPEEKSRPSSATHESGENVKIVGKQSSKSVPGRRKDGRKKDFLPLKKRHSSLQRYKIRSKSLPQGVRRKFGFGGYVEVFDPNLNLRPNSRSQSKTSLKADSYISFKTIKSEGQVKAKFGEAKHSNVGRNTSSTARSLPFKVSKSKVNDKTKEMSKSYSSKSVKSESAVPKNFEKVSQSSNADSQVSCTKSGTINFCRDIAPSNSIAKGPITDPNLNHLMSKPNALIPFLRQPIPFIPCSSTSKSFNLGLNVQQVLSLIKHRRHSITLQTVIKNGLRATRSITDIIEPTVNTLFFSHTTTSHSQVTSALCPARSCIEDTFSIVTDDIGCRSNCSLLKQTQAMRSEMMEDKKLENLNEDVEINKFHRPEDVWVVEQPDNSSKNCKKSRSRCTCYPSKHCVDYQKVLREYTGWRGHKAASFSSETYSSYHPMITYSRPKLCPIPSQENVDWGFQENNGKIELMKVHNDLNNLNR